MALLTTYGASNRVIINDKTVTYSKRRIYGGGWSYVSGTVVVTLGSVWEYHRYCVKTYMYVGMDRTTAQSCASNMIQKYTRQFKISDWTGTQEFTDISGGSVCMADVVIQKRAGQMYDVVVSVREDDSRNRVASVFDPSVLFSTENNRDYDE